MENPKPDELGTDEGKENPEEIPETPEQTSSEPVKGSEEEVKLKKQLSESSKEGIRLKKLSEDQSKEIEGLKTELEDYKTSDEIPLDQKELEKKYPYWDDMTDSEKENIRTIERLKIKQARLDADLRKEKQDRIKKEEEDRFERSFKKVLDSPAFAEDLKGREDEFKEFCYRDKNLGNTNLEVLAKSFLFDVVKDRNKDEELKGRKGLETTTGGQKQTPPKEGMTAEEVDALRKSNPRKYNEMIRDGKLKMIE